MESTSITPNIARSKKAIDRYFKYERKRNFDKPTVLALTFFNCALLLAGFVINVKILWFLVLISAGIFILFLLIYLLQFRVAKNKIFKKLEFPEYKEEYLFTFDSEQIGYQSKSRNLEIKWNLIKSYTVNANDIYLYLAQRELLDIISEEILGLDTFKKFKSILQEKVKN